MILTIIGKESFFEKNIGNKNGQGPMGVTGIAVRSFFPTVKNNWHSIYKEMNEPLLNEILYKKDANGKFIKDANDNFVLKYKTPEELRDACSKDDELGIKVGTLLYQMNYASAVGEHNFKVANWKTTLKAIKGLKDGSIKLNETDNKACLTTALKNYNSVFKSYASTAIKFLTDHGVRLNKCYITPSVK